MAANTYLPVGLPYLEVAYFKDASKLSCTKARWLPRGVPRPGGGAPSVAMMPPSVVNL